MDSKRSSQTNRESVADETDLLLVRAAWQRAATRLAGERGLPDYPRLAEAFRRHTALDAAGLGPELARLRNIFRGAPPQPPTVWGRFAGAAGRALSPLLWRLLRAIGGPNPFDAVCEMLLCELEWQLASEHRIAGELAAIRARIEDLETILHDRRAVR